MRHLGHFGAMVVFAAFVSVAFSCLTHRTTGERVRYAAYAFLAFVGAAVGIAWLLYFFSR